LPEIKNKNPSILKIIGGIRIKKWSSEVELHTPYVRRFTSKLPETEDHEEVSSVQLLQTIYHKAAEAEETASTERC